MEKGQQIESKDRRMKNIVKIIEINEMGKSIKEKINKSRVSLKRLIKLINCWQDRSRKKKTQLPISLEDIMKNFMLLNLKIHMK